MANVQNEIIFYDCTLALPLPFPYKMLLMVLDNSSSSASSELSFKPKYEPRGPWSSLLEFNEL